MKKIVLNRIILLFISFVAFFAGCKKESMCNCLEKTGDEVTETRDVSSFNSIEMNNNVDVILIQDTFFKVTVTCGENLIDGIKTEVTDQKLKIKNINKCNWLRDFENKYTVRVTLPELLYVETTGSGDLTCIDTIRGNRILIESHNGAGDLNFLLNYSGAEFKLHTGPADIIASGQLIDCYVYSAGNGYFRGNGITSQNVTVNTKSTGDCEVNSNKQLDVNIEYNGNVYYSGNPQQITKTITGNGNLISR